MQHSTAHRRRVVSQGDYTSVAPVHSTPVSSGFSDTHPRGRGARLAGWRQAGYPHQPHRDPAILECQEGFVLRRALSPPAAAPGRARRTGVQVSRHDCVKVQIRSTATQRVKVSHDSLRQVKALPIWPIGDDNRALGHRLEKRGIQTVCFDPIDAVTYPRAIRICFCGSDAPRLDIRA